MWKKGTLGGFQIFPLYIYIYLFISKSSLFFYFYIKKFQNFEIKKLKSSKFPLAETYKSCESAPLPQFEISPPDGFFKQRNIDKNIQFNFNAV